MKKWLLNPFEMLAGWPALLAGLAVMSVTACAAFYGRIHLDGVLDLHVGTASPFYVYVFESLMNWLCMAAFTFFSGLIFSRSSIRIIDVLGTQAAARFPFLISTLGSLLFYRDNITQFLEANFLGKGREVPVSVADLVLFALMLVITILMTVWAVALMYKAYSVSCNVKGGKAIFSFIGCLVFAEGFSKTFISLIW